MSSVLTRRGAWYYYFTFAQARRGPLC